MSIIRAEDILAHNGDVGSALRAKRVEAEKHLEKTGSMPLWWELGVSLGSSKGPPMKFASPDEFYSQGYAYFEHCAESETMPTQAGLVLWMGFSNNPAWHAYARRNIEFREVHGKLQSLLQHVLEQGIFEPGGQAGKIFLLKNVSDGFLPDDPVNQPLRFAYKEKQQTEITGANGGPLVISREMDPEEAYLKMLDGGVLEPEKEEPGEPGEPTSPSCVDP